MLALFWLVNDPAERAGRRGDARRVRPAGSAPLLPRAATRRRRLRRDVRAARRRSLLFELLPFYFIFVTAFKSKLQIQQIQSMFWPHPWTLDHFRFLFTEIPFASWYRNTIIVAAVSTAVSVLVASLGAYGLVRLQVARRRRRSAPSVLVAYLMPTALMFIPLYFILAQLRLHQHADWR